MCWWFQGRSLYFPKAYQELSSAKISPVSSKSCRTARSWGLGLRLLDSIPSVSVGSVGKEQVCCFFVRAIGRARCPGWEFSMESKGMRRSLPPGDIP